MGNNNSIVVEPEKINSEIIEQEKINSNFEISQPTSNTNEYLKKHFEWLENLKCQFNVKRQHVYDSLKLKYVRTDELTFNGTVDYGRKFNTHLPRHSDNSSNYVYKNLRFVSKSGVNLSKFIKYCFLEIGGRRIDQIYEQTFNTLRHIYNINDKNIIPFYFNADRNCLPIVKYHDYTIHFEAVTEEIPDFDPRDFKISVDIYEAENLHKNFNDYTIDNRLEYSNMVTQYSGTEIIKNKHNKIQFDFMTRVSHIIVNSLDDKIEKLRLYLNGIEIEIELDKIEKIDDNYIIPLTKSLSIADLHRYCIDFSTIDVMQLMIVLKDEKEFKECPVNIYAVSQQIMQICNGIFDVKYRF